MNRRVAVGHGVSEHDNCALGLGWEDHPVLRVCRGIAVVQGKLRLGSSCDNGDLRRG
jgi:hypothetical protein